jgi:uncharacterized protein
VSKDGGVTRRGFVRSLIGSAAFAALADHVRPLRTFAQIVNANSPMPSRALGKTGYDVRLFSLGGQATLEDAGKRATAVEIINRAIDLGVNYIDTASSYGRGASEEVIGEVMRTRRNEVFLASKTHDRSYDGSMRLLELSLKRLQTDHLDLWQIHNIQTHTDVDFVLSGEGAVRAIEKARKEGTVRFTGITGHKDPFVLRRAIEQYPFDTILMALNAADKHNASFIEHLLPLAVEKNMGIMGMKVPSRGRIFHETGIRTMEQAMGYVLTLPVSTAVIGISTLQELEDNIRIAREFKPYDPKEMAQLERLTQPYFADALWYREHM